MSGVKKRAAFRFLFSYFILIAVGVGLLTYGIISLAKNINFVQSAEIIQAEITNIESYYTYDSDGDKNHHHDVYVAYEYDGYYYDSELNEYSSSMYEGKIIDIYVDPDDPGHIQYKNMAYWGPILIIILGLITLVISFAPYIRLLVAKIQGKPIGETNNRGAAQPGQYAGYNQNPTQQNQYAGYNQNPKQSNQYTGYNQNPEQSNQYAGYNQNPEQSNQYAGYNQNPPQQNQYAGYGPMSVYAEIIDCTVDYSYQGDNKPWRIHCRYVDGNRKDHYYTSEPLWSDFRQYIGRQVVVHIQDEQHYRVDINTIC